MPGIFELHEIASITLFTVAFGKAGRLLEGNHSVSFGVENETGWKSFLGKAIGGAVKFSFFRGSEAIIANSLSRCVADWSEENHSAWLRRWPKGVFLRMKCRRENRITSSAGANRNNAIGIDTHVGRMHFKK